MIFLDDWESAKVQKWTPGIGGTVMISSGEVFVISLEEHVHIDSPKDMTLTIKLEDREPEMNDELIIMPTASGECYWTFKSDILLRLPHFTQTLRLVSKESGSRKKVLWAGSARDPILSMIIGDNEHKKGVYQIAGITLWFEVLKSDYTWRKVFHPHFQ